MAEDFQIVDVSTYGIKAEITDWMKSYSTYKDFANAAGHPDAVLEGIFDRHEDIGITEVTVLAFGMHGTFHRQVFVVQNDVSGDKYLIGREGLRILPRQADTSQITTKITIDGKELMELIRPIREEVSDKVRELTVNKAKEDVEAIVARGSDITAFNYTPIGNNTYLNRFYTVEFVVNREKRTVVALIHINSRDGDISNRDAHKGIAKCNPDDCFNEHIGKAVAVRRAFDLPIPDEYLTAPQPTEPKEGAHIRVYYEDPLITSSPYFEGKVIRKASTNLYKLGVGGATSFDPKDGDRVIDDSDVY